MRMRLYACVMVCVVVVACDCVMVCISDVYGVTCMCGMCACVIKSVMVNLFDVCGVCVHACVVRVPVQ